MLLNSRLCSCICVVVVNVSLVLFELRLLDSFFTHLIILLNFPDISHHHITDTEITFVWLKICPIPLVTISLMPGCDISRRYEFVHLFVCLL